MSLVWMRMPGRSRYELVRVPEGEQASAMTIAYVVNEREWV
jgi:hypothetical protein